jgi:hypothetical protein
MGASQSSNVAEAVTNVSNFVSNSTTANTNQVNQISDQISLNNCSIQLSGDFNVKSSANLLESNSQIVSALQDANLQNNIQQQMQQQATSKVGFLGIGYASANNASNQLVNSTSQITNSINASASQYSDVNQQFNCNRSTIIADNVDIGFYSNSDFLSSQTLNNKQTASLINDVSQTVSQKASATVEGLGALILIILAILALIMYTVTKPLSSGSGAIIVAGIIIIIVVGIIVFMYLRNTEPFFSKPCNCINHSAIGLGDNDCTDMSNQTVNLTNPPTKYIYSILPSSTNGNLLQMSIAQASGQSKSDSGSNGGYRVDTYVNLDSRINQYEKYAQKLNIPNIPNPLKVITTGDNNNPYYQIPNAFIGADSGGDSAVCTPSTIRVCDQGEVCITTSDFTSVCRNNKTSYQQGIPFDKTILSKTSIPYSGIANLNLDEWVTYLKNDDQTQTRALFARFVLCDIIGNIELHHYIRQNELIKFTDTNNNVIIDVAGNKTYPNDTYMFHPNSNFSDMSTSYNGSGYLRGQVGYVNDNTYKFQKFMKKIGVWILLAILLLTLIYMFFKRKSDSKLQQKVDASLEKIYEKTSKIAKNIDTTQKTDE